MKSFAFSGALCALSLALAAPAAPAAAQDSSYTWGDYWDVSEIEIIDGQEENYMDFLSSQWKKTQEFSKSKGWIKDYRVVANIYARDGEADLYLITVYADVPSAGEMARRDKEYESFMARNSRTLTAESGARGTMRKQMGSQMLQEVKLK
ncbi:hypothetical protein [Sphingobium boeckii]|uniref:Uncharacterized protein n=1 Tax=Sphingobium boeckii TaxID=1082345 RepID=A0A7W9EF15_9SPHN|nr:hypothetical protein [Sphingobium boeckii]MBB5686838.1 hypothetical protein [Sphingobium boeckii]